MMTWTSEEIAWHDRILKQKREREAEIRKLLGWTDTRVGLYTIDSYLPVPTLGHSFRSARRVGSTQLAQKRHRHKRGK